MPDRTGEIARTSPVRRTPFKTKRAVVSRQERSARLLVKRRSGGLCELVLPGCTVWATDWCHRIARGRGGKWTASDGLHGCRSCHWAITNTNGRRAEYERAGYIVRTGADTATVPVLIGPQRHRVLLTDDGLYDHLPTISSLSDYQQKGA